MKKKKKTKMMDKKALVLNRFDKQLHFMELSIKDIKIHWSQRDYSLATFELDDEDIEYFRSKHLKSELELVKIRLESCIAETSILSNTVKLLENS